MNQFCVNNFGCSVAYVVHALYPKQLIPCFELFGDAFLFGKLFYKPVKHFIRFFINVGKVIVKFTRCQ